MLLRPPNCLRKVSPYFISTLPHHIIKDKLIDLIERTFSRERALYLSCNEERALFTSDENSDD